MLLISDLGKREMSYIGMSFLNHNAPNLNVQPILLHDPEAVLPSGNDVFITEIIHANQNLCILDDQRGQGFMKPCGSKSMFQSFNVEFFSEYNKGNKLAVYCMEINIECIKENV